MDPTTNQDCRNNCDWLQSICDFLSSVANVSTHMDSQSTKLYIQIVSRLVDAGINEGMTKKSIYTSTLNHSINSFQQLHMKENLLQKGNIFCRKNYRVTYKNNEF